ncbi:hypothetical protein JP75_20220 [Devosia riboflavina]|uniref:ABC transporter substrate-binding protein n=1 Tax=Devosia riboflavina TaxID=46914 RepID=A0A087LY62_9HYPH|nr:tripartite tricarboxylate transporter substrate binding protein [Devosia riboflavina]KFL29565.1 hypothetical protein JP75_20220 [Devosia riboflavina]
MNKIWLAAGAILCGSALVAPVMAQDYPARPVQVVATGTAGTPTDIVARALAEALSASLGQRFVVENHPSANGAVAGGIVAEATPDGYSLLMASSSVLSVMPHLNEALTWDPFADLDPIISIGTAPLAIGVPPNSPYNTLEELVAGAKANPGDITAGAFSLALAHLAVLMLDQAADIDTTFVGYANSADLLTAGMSGEIGFMINGAGPLIPLFAAGSLKPIAVTSSKRFEGLPDVPTVAETYPGYDAGSWFGLFGPHDLDPAVRDKLVATISEIVQAPAFREQLLGLGASARILTGDDFKAVIRSDYDRFGSLIAQIQQ